MKRLLVYTLTSLLSVGGFAQSETATEKPNSLEVHVPSVSSLSAFQFDLQMPEGVTIVETENGVFQANIMVESADHELRVASLGNGLYRFLGFSRTNAEITLEDNDILLAAQVEGLGNIAGGGVVPSLSDVLFVTNEVTIINSADTELRISTGIRSVKLDTTDGERWYNLNGQRVEKPGKGLYIRNGEKVIVK